MRLLIGNDFSEDLRDDRGWAGWWVQRIVWFAQNHDVIVLPVEPQLDFFEYVASLVGIDSSTLQFCILPEGSPRQGGAVTASQLADDEFRRKLRATIGNEKVDTILPLWPDASVAGLACWLGAEDALPGGGFMGQGGGAFVNSKAAFRSVAGGIGVPISPGGVCGSSADAEELIMTLLDRGEPVMMKKEFLSGGRGNEILSPVPGVRPVGARRVVFVPDRAAVQSYLKDRWGWLSSDGQHRVIIETYYRDSFAVFAEYHVTDDGSELRGQGEIISAPYDMASIMPSVRIEADMLPVLVEEGRRICDAMRAIGYRGILDTDAIVTPERELYFTEYNGRVTGSTHLYEGIGRRVVGDNYADDRILLERTWPAEWSAPSFKETVDRIAGAGLAYDPATRTGVVLTSAFNSGDKSVMHIVVAPDIDTAYDLDEQLEPLFTNSRA